LSNFIFIIYTVHVNEYILCTFCKYSLDILCGYEVNICKIFGGNFNLVVFCVHAEFIQAHPCPASKECFTTRMFPGGKLKPT
jgi:hypothetical protein